MEANVPVTAKSIWSIVRVAFFMLRKGISKRKLMLDLNMMMKRGKIARKAITNLMFHHAHHVSSAPREYEFSCSNTPNYASTSPTSTATTPTSSAAPPTLDDDATSMNAVKAVLLHINGFPLFPSKHHQHQLLQNQQGKSVSLGQQALVALVLTLVYQFFAYIFKKF